ncbi:MAG: sugar ABC transporter permease [Gammaproteobacteria bacterium]|nr:sugar ABC transporter permease [Gammaproteobacteria bacterium]
MGFGNFYHGQIVKGIIYSGLEVLFFLYMILCPNVTGPSGVKVPTGYKSLANLALQGEENRINPITGRPIPDDSSQLFLLFGLVTIAVIILFIILYFSNLKSSFKADNDVKEGRKPTTFVEDLKALLDGRFHVLMIAPTCIAALIFTVLPTIFMICMAFTTYNIVDMNMDPKTNLFHWNGFTNFASIFTGNTTLGAEIHARFLPILGWTFIWAIFATFTCYFGGIILALLINKKGLKGKKIFRTIFILTIAIPQFISLLAMRNLLSDSGPVNSMLKNFGWIEEPISFLGNRVTGNNPTVAKVMVIIINMWLGIPYTMLMTSGILMNIPTDLYEAARVDGTGRMKMFFKITLPYVIFVTTPYLISSFVGNINSFNTIFLLTGGGPSVDAYKGGETDLLVTWLYKLTIDNGMYNTGAVIGILTFLITSTITLITYRRSKAYNEEDTFQ